MADKMEFSRGDPAYHTFDIEADAWTAGGTLFFEAKPAIDDDNTDAAAVISAHWGDSSVTDVVIDGVAYKEYACTFPPSATNSILSGGADSTDYLGEFQLVDTSGVPTTFPANNDKIDAIVYFDVIRKTAA